MGQRTVVLKLDPNAAEALEERLKSGTFDYRSVAHARFSAHGEGVVATLYRSGKLVVQGREVDLFLARYLDQEPPPEGAANRDQPGSEPIDRTVIGSDETGKGDYFGPLVVAAFKLPATARSGLREGGVTDSKRLSDERVRRLAPALMEHFEHAVLTLDPPEYNAAYARTRNLNSILADLHARALRQIFDPKALVWVDRFADERLLATRLADLDPELRQTPRGEREPAVAAASILARFVFLERLDELSREFAVDLHKGAGAPTDAAAREFLSLHGESKLEQVAKLHFKNTAKARSES